jgi:D-alanyl-D-alanine carboxypeptidase
MSFHHVTRFLSRARVLIAVAVGATAVAAVIALNPSTAASDRFEPQPVGVPVLDAASDHDRAMTRLDPALADAFRRARADARDAGVEISVTSGWRSPEHQQRLLRDAVVQYGSAEEASRWVATPETSPHVSGDAIDVGPMAATDWLAQRGASYGLCQIYANESWHYELRPDAVTDGCPEMYADPTEDPRMRP